MYQNQKKIKNTKYNYLVFFYIKIKHCSNKQHKKRT